MINFLPKRTKPQLSWGMKTYGAEGGIHGAFALSCRLVLLCTSSRSFSFLVCCCVHL